MPASPSPPLVVYKLGGSLLELPDLNGVIRRLLAERPGHAAALIVGGGAAADLVRNWDRVHHLGDEVAHWLALDAMSLNEALVAKLVCETQPARSASQVAAATASGRVALLCANCFVRWGEAAGHARLPRSWQLSSDSIAAWAAGILGADELVLLKSVPLSVPVSFAEAAKAGLVDECFATFAAPLQRIGWVDARSQAPSIQPWRH